MRTTHNSLLNEKSIPAENDPLKNIHPDPMVISSIKNFKEGEEKHTVATCNVCKETRPVFHASYHNKTSHVKLNSWKIDKNGLRARSKTDRYKRQKKGNQPAKFSGQLSSEEELRPIYDTIRHNNQHFLPIPPYLQKSIGSGTGFGF